MELGFLQEVKAIIKSLVLSSPQKMSIQELDRDFRATEGYPIPYGKLGFRTLESFLLSIGDTVKVHGHGTMATLCCLGNGKSDHIRDMIMSQKKPSRRHTKMSRPPLNASRNVYADIHKSKYSFESDTKFDFKNKQTRNRTSGLSGTHSLGHSQEKYVTKSKVIPNVNNLRVAPPVRYKSLDTWTCHSKKVAPIEAVEEELSGTVNRLQINDENSEHLLSIQKLCNNERSNGVDPAKVEEDRKLDIFQISNSNKELFDDLEEAIPQFAANNLVFRLDFPENTVVFGQKINPYALTDNLKKGSIIGVFISEIHNPYKFWFHLYEKNHELDFLMYNIERFYKGLDNDEFVLPISCHVPGQICAALYNNLWHRGEIVGYPKSNKTKVFFLDYGTVSEVNAEDIKYLASVFATIPSQAIRGSLSHIKPRGLHWSHEATQYFLSIVCELMLYGQIAEVDKQNRILHMVICNTYGPETTQINKMLVEKNFAVYDENWNDERIEKNGMRWHHPREDFPTFEMIERGEYPSLSEIIDLHNGGINYEKIIDGKIFHHGKLNNHENAPEALRNLPFLLLSTNPFKYDIILELHRPVKII